MTTKSNAPKTKESAITVGVSLSNQFLKLEQKEENLMSMVSKTRDKLKRLEETLDELEKQIQKVLDQKEVSKDQLNSLKDQWNITEAEILEARNSLYRDQIAKIEKRMILSDAKQESEA